MKFVALTFLICLVICGDEPPKTFKLDFESGSFVFQNISWTVKPESNENPWFESQVVNLTGTDWKEVYLLVRVVGNDNARYSFQAPISLGFHLGETSEVSVLKPYPAVALPIKSIEAQFLFGIERRTTQSQLYSGPVVLQKDCISDMVATYPLYGLNLRKKLTDLVQYGCIEMSDESYLKMLLDQLTVANGSKKFAFVLAPLFSIDPSSTTSHIGWIRSDQIRNGTRLELVDRGHRELIRR